ncbi:hypothetical protein RJT34_18650 [Clitoria ternatea]|uniref:Cyclotide n=1 Tax=Clitoria ternatea TaxID=43366 RepID=A0AAN9JDG5_CLITE
MMHWFFVSCLCLKCNNCRVEVLVCTHLFIFDNHSLPRLFVGSGNFWYHMLCSTFSIYILMIHLESSTLVF